MSGSGSNAVRPGRPSLLLSTSASAFFFTKWNVWKVGKDGKKKTQKRRPNVLVHPPFSLPFSHIKLISAENALVHSIHATDLHSPVQLDEF